MSVIGSTAMHFDAEQALLLDYARSFCRDAGGIATVRERLEASCSYRADDWRAMVAMGWTGIGVPETAGGSGLGIGAAVPLLEGLGRSLFTTPLLSSLLAAQLLLRATGDAQHALLASIAAGARVAVAAPEPGAEGAVSVESGGLRGGVHMVLDAADAEYLLIPARERDRPVLALLAADALPAGRVRPCRLIDLTRRAADVNVDALPAELVAEGERVAAAVADHHLLGALLVAAESTGAAASCLDTVVEYLKTRTQFGRPIGSYQALKHPAVDMLLAVDNSRSFIYHAASLVDAGPLDRDAEIACRMAKAQASETLKFAGDRAVQFHGGMGFTWDCDAQLYIRRAQWAQQQFGDARHHRQRLAALLLD